MHFVCYGVIGVGLCEGGCSFVGVLFGTKC